MTAPGRTDKATDQVLGEIRSEIAELFGAAFPPESVRVDVDVFEGSEPLVEDLHFDSMDLVRVIAALEDRFDLSLATILSGDEPLTLMNVARSIACVER